MAQIDRRDFLKLSGTALAATQIDPYQSFGQDGQDGEWRAQWIWYPGQLAAYRHSRRVRLAMERCTGVGYPGNFRQPVTETYFRKSGSADIDTPLRWAAPVSRVRYTIAGRGGDITSRQATFPKGAGSLGFQIDFAQSLPCLLLEGGDFSTGATWEASLDGEHWVRAETGGGSEPATLPDASREVIVKLPVNRVVDLANPQAAPASVYSIASSKDLLLDFRETELGALVFEVRGNGQLMIQVGESMAEARDPDPRYFEQYPLSPVVLTPSPQTITLPERALRFAHFSTPGTAELRNVRFDASLWPSHPQGHFESSDPELNAIWTTAVATLRSNMHDFYLDGIRRDGLLWHDGPLTLDAYERVFFDADLSRQTLIAETLPLHPTIRDVGIIDAPMYDIIGFEREYLIRGDPSFSLMFRDRIEDIVQFYISLQNDRGFIDATKVEPYGFFPDWSATQQSGPDGHGTPAYGQILLAATFSAAARLAGAWNDSTAQQRYQASALRLRTSISETFWNPQQRLYSNGLDRYGKTDPRFTSFAQAFAVAYGIAKPTDYDSIFRFLNDETKRPAHYSLSQVVELTAYARAGQTQQALDRLKSAWLPMIRNGYLRFFEDIEAAKAPDAQLAMYGRKYAASLCHAWAGAAPIMAISRGVLGIEPLQPGFRVCSVNPQRCDLQSGQGAVPTPQGLIQLEWIAAKGELQLPRGITARLANGREVKGPGRFTINL